MSLIYLMGLAFLLANVVVCYRGCKGLRAMALPLVPLWQVIWVLLVLALSSIPFWHLGGLLPEWNQRLLLLIGYDWLIVVFYLVVFIILVSLVFWFIDPEKSLRGRVWLKALTLVLLVAVLVGTGTYFANATKITAYEVNIAKPAAGLNSLNLVFVSDFHLGIIENETKLARWVEEINALDPQIICLGGDILNSGLSELSNPQAFQQELARLSAPYGVYACLGNHDLGWSQEGWGEQELADWLQKAGIQLLRDQFVEVAGLVVAGREYSSNWNGEEILLNQEFLAEADPAQPIILMEHIPSNLSSESPADLILAGHTHLGQVFPMNLITNQLFENDYGYSRNQTSQMVVSSGLGTWGPDLRLGSQAEIVQVTLNFQSEF